MKVLVTNRKILTWFCACPADPFTSKWQKLAYKTFSILSCILLSSLIVSTAIFVGRFISSDLEESLYTIFQVTGTSPALYFTIAALNSQHKIAAIFENLSAIYNTSKISFNLINF